MSFGRGRGLLKSSGGSSSKESPGGDGDDSGSLILSALSLGRPPSSRGRGRGLTAERLGSFLGSATPRPVSLLNLTADHPEVHQYGDDEVILPPKKYGSAGEEIPLEVNYVRLKLIEGKGIFFYLVTFSPVVDAKDQRFKLLGQHSELLGSARTFDGSKLLLPKEMPQTVTELTSICPLTQAKIKVSLTFKKRMAFEDKEAITLFNLIFRRIMSSLKMVQVNRNYYYPENKEIIPQHKLEIWPGYVTSVNEHDGGLVLQCDVSHRVLRTVTVLDVFKEISLKRRGDFKNEVIKALVGSVVLTRYNCKTYRIDDIDFNMSPASTFKDSRGGEVSFVQYYKERYGLDIRDSKQPLLYHRPKARDIREGGAELIALIPELCYLTGLSEEMRSDFRLMKDVAVHTRLSPAQRRASLMKFIASVLGSPEAEAHLSLWGMKMAKIPMKCKGRALSSETLFFGQGVQERVGPNVDWTRVITSKHALTPIHVNNWAIIFPSKLKDIARGFAQYFEKQGPRLGINVARPIVKEIGDDRSDTYIRAMREIMSTELQCIVTVFPNLRADRYAAVKKFCYLERPVASQVILSKTISQEKRMVSVVQKIALQINCKLGGELWGAEVPKPNIMIVGVDVYHDPSRHRNSVAGVVASMNDSLSQWYSRSAVQNPGEELLKSMKRAFSDCLIRFKERNGVFPESIVVYRDGLGDSQLEMAANYEIEQFISALKDHSSNSYAPSFTFIVVQKRINSRYYHILGSGLSNPPAGTVLDTGITHKKLYDFFIVSQRVNEGTATPSHFIVLKEGSDTSPDFLQRLSYRLTHMYYNWPGTIRVPAPCQYAHKLAAMVGENLQKEPSSSLSDKLFYL